MDSKELMLNEGDPQKLRILSQMIKQILKTDFCLLGSENLKGMF